MRILKKAGVLSTVFASGAALAQESSSTPIDLTAASTAVTNISESVTGFITGDLLTALLSVLGAGVVIWVVILAWKFIKRGGKQAG